MKSQSSPDLSSSLICRALIDFAAPTISVAAAESPKAHPAGLLFSTGYGSADEVTSPRLAEGALSPTVRVSSLAPGRKGLSPSDDPQRAERKATLLHPAGDLCAVTSRPFSRERTFDTPTAGAQNSQSSSAHPAGLLYGVTTEDPFATRQPVLRQTQAFANARCWPAVGLMTAQNRDNTQLIAGIASLQKALKTQDASDHVGTVFVRFFGDSNVPDVASSRLDLSLGLARAGATVFEQLSTTRNREACETKRSYAQLKVVKAKGARAFVDAGLTAASLVRDLANHARALVQDDDLKLSLLFAQAEQLPPHMQEMLAFHNSLIHWPHAHTVSGTLRNSLCTHMAIEGWTQWQHNMFARIDTFVGPSLAAEFSGRAGGHSPEGLR